ncbi:DUF2946 domain-containing protein [Paraburkholderia heleia]|uniref:DUF2946 domain-containing protein n=1 Tax=Paraburkholderia heleia TaxID=634127 RepID=UPI000A04E899
MYVRASAFKRLFPWFALCAMWLLVCLPLASQVLASRIAREPVAGLCSGSGASPGKAGQTAGALVHCGYCDLLSSHPGLCAATSTTQPPQLIISVVVSQAPIPPLPVLPFLAARPRDPPHST